MAKATGGDKAQFTYDFGIAIAQSTVQKVARLTGASLTLASAFYALKSTAAEYVNTLRQNTLHFGGMMSTMKAMEDAQNRLVKGMTTFSVDDQLAGMRQLMNVGIDVEKNMEWVSKAAHATGKSYAEFSGAISSAIQGNMGALVDMGLMTQRATKMFDKYGANTVMRQQAILNFVKQHKGLQSAIANDFVTIQDQIMRIKETWKGFLQSVIGKPNDPSSLYGQVASTMKMVADSLGSVFHQIKNVGAGIGMVLGWVVKQAGKFVTWLGGVVRKTLSHIWTSSDNFVEWCRSLVVWLEFWKLKIIDFFKTYKDEIIFAAKAVLAFMVLKKAFVIGSDAIDSVKTYLYWLQEARELQKRYLAFQGPDLKGAKLQSMAAYMPKGMRKMWVKAGKTMGKLFSSGFGKSVGTGISSIFKGAGGIIGSPIMIIKQFFKGTKGGIRALLHGHFKWAGLIVKRYFGAIFTNMWGYLKGFFGPFLKLFKGGFGMIGRTILRLPKIVGIAFKAIKALWAGLNASNPIGWIILAVTAVILLYKKCAGFRKFVNMWGKAVINWFKTLWNTVMLIYAAIRFAIQKVWGWICSVINNIIGGIKSIWKNMMNSKFGQWLNTHIVEPVSKVFDWIVGVFGDFWNSIVGIVKKICDALGIACDGVGDAADYLAEKGGFKVATLDSTDSSIDDTDYLDPSNWNFGGDKKSNPLDVGTASSGSFSGGGMGGGSSSTNINYAKGAIEIIINGEGLNEDLLAKKIKQVILDTNREAAVRGGSAV